MLSKRADVSLTVMPEPFISVDEAAEFLCIRRRHLLELARRDHWSVRALHRNQAQNMGLVLSQNLLLRLSTEILRSNKMPKLGDRASVSHR
jgi:hypothetical protein